MAIHRLFKSRRLLAGLRAERLNKYSDFANDFPEKFINDYEVDDADDVNLQFSVIARNMINDTEADEFTIYEQSMLTRIREAKNMSDRYSVFATDINNKSVIKSITSHAAHIARHGAANSMQVIILARHHIVSGVHLQKSLAQRAFSYTNDFNKTRAFAVAIAKITDKNAMYVYKKDNPLQIIPASGRYIRRVIKSHASVRKAYIQAIHKRQAQDARIVRLREQL